MNDFPPFLFNIYLFDSNHFFKKSILSLLLKARAAINVATQPWFIGMMVSIALLLIILINVCVLVKERGGKYSVQEKEPFQNQMLSDGQGFDEYQKKYIYLSLSLFYIFKYSNIHSFEMILIFLINY